jgi:hypothetical protein
VHVGVALVTDSEAAEVVQVSEAALHDPALAAEAGAVCCSPSGDHGRDPESPQEPAVLVVVIAAVGQEPVGLLAWPADLASHGPAVEVFDQRDQLGNIVAIPASQPDREWDAARVDQEMVL